MRYLEGFHLYEREDGRKIVFHVGQEEEKSYTTAWDWTL
jgi:hypothetical protein